MRPRVTENGRQEMEEIDWQDGTSLIVILLGRLCALVTVLSLSEGHGRSRCCLLIRGGHTVCVVWFCGTSLLSHIKARPWSAVWAMQVGSNSASHVSIWQHKRSRAFKKLWILSVFQKQQQISHVMNGNMTIFRAWGPLEITSQEKEEKTFPRNTAHGSCVYLKSNFLEIARWQAFLLQCDLECLYTVLNNFLACVPFIFAIGLTLWQMSGAVMQPVCKPSSTERWGDYSLQSQLKNV